MRLYSIRKWVSNMLVGVQNNKESNNSSWRRRNGTQTQDYGLGINTNFVLLRVGVEQI